MYSPPNSPGATPASAAAGKENPSRLGESIWKGDVGQHCCRFSKRAKTAALVACVDAAKLAAICWSTAEVNSNCSLSGF